MHSLCAPIFHYGYVSRYGYRAGQVVVATPTGCTGRAITNRVLIMPYGPTDFDIETNLQLVNVTARINAFGTGQINYATNRSPSFVSSKWLLVGFLALLNLAAFAFIISMTMYEGKITRDTTKAIVA
jgi:hypothetical protein